MFMLPARLAILLSVLLLAGGCSSYKIEGRVVRGSSSDLAFVSPDDPRLAHAGVSDATIAVDRDPGTLGRTNVATVKSDGGGRFSIPINAFGAGWMDEEWVIEAGRGGSETVKRVLRLPAAKDGRRLLIVLADGPVSVPVGQEDLWEQYERFK
jgi:hypothetical protein